MTGTRGGVHENARGAGTQRERCPALQSVQLPRGSYSERQRSVSGAQVYSLHTALFATYRFGIARALRDN